MTTIEDKIKLFTKIIYEKLDEENSEIVRNFEKEKEQKLETLNKYMKDKKLEVLTEASKRAEIKYSEIITAQRIKSQQSILALKQSIISETLELVKKKFIEFVKSDNYKSYLLELIDVCMLRINESDYTIYFTAQDLDKYESDIKAELNKYSVKVDIKKIDFDIIGGFLIEKKDGKYRIDCSFATKIQDNRELAALRCMKISS